jgi:ketosteroid isomerase-like protein
MSEENVEVVRRMYAAFQRGDAEASLAHFDPEVRVDMSRRGVGGVGRGRDDLSRIIGEWVASWDDWREEIEEIRDLGSQICVVAVQRGRGKGSGVEVENRYGVLYEFTGNKISRLTGYGSPQDALEAARLSD